MRQTKDGIEIEFEELVRELNTNTGRFKVTMKCDCLPISFTFISKHIERTREANALSFLSDSEIIRVGRIHKVLKYEPIGSKQTIYTVEACGIGSLKTTLTIYRYPPISS